MSRIIPADRISTNEALAKHSSFKIGGPADVFVQPATQEELLMVIEECRKNSEEYEILGHASNVLIPDEGLRKVVIQLSPHYSGCKVEGHKLEAEAGALLANAANLALQESLTGLEFASGIPGTVGGAICMNAGAYDHEIANICESVELLRPDGRIIVVPGNKMGFGYRTSVIQGRGAVVLSAAFALKPGDKSEIKAYMTKLNGKRRETQPLELPSVGSTFKRPEGHFAGKLISECDLKGYAIGGAMVSEKHAGFIVNTGGATADDVLRLMEHVQKTVSDRFGVTLEPEVKILCNS